MSEANDIVERQKDNIVFEWNESDVALREKIDHEFAHTWLSRVAEPTETCCGRFGFINTDTKQKINVLRDFGQILLDVADSLESELQQKEDDTSE